MPEPRWLMERISVPSRPSDRGSQKPIARGVRNAGLRMPGPTVPSPCVP
jgi:hypothetical protein